MKPRYSIVRVDNSCPAMLDDFGCIIARNMLHCKCGEDTKNYGDTKEQMILKVAQALLIDEIERYRKAPNCDVNQTIIEHESRICLEKARKIVEFLGVKE